MEKRTFYILLSLMSCGGFGAGVVVSPLSPAYMLLTFLLIHCYVGVVSFFKNWLKNGKRIPKKMWIISLFSSPGGIMTFVIGDYFYKKSAELK